MKGLPSSILPSQLTWPDQSICKSHFIINWLLNINHRSLFVCHLVVLSQLENLLLIIIIIYFFLPVGSGRAPSLRNFEL